MARRDEATFVEFATSVRGSLRASAYLLCGDWHQAADLVQEALIRVYVAWPRMHRHGSETAYAKRVLVNAFLDQRRRRSSTERPSEITPDSPGTQDLAEEVVERAALMAGLRRLPPRQRACVVLRYLDDLDVNTTAQILGCSAGTVKSQTSKALRTLRGSIGPLPLDSPGRRPVPHHGGVAR